MRYELWALRVVGVFDFMELSVGMAVRVNCQTKNTGFRVNDKY